MSSFDDLGEPLFGVTFVVLDLETTGGSPEMCAITEVGALKLRGGVCLGKFRTLVNPGVAIPPDVTYLTGITEAMVLPAPSIDSVLPALLEFMAGAVIVGHNVRFDLGFLQTALRRQGYPRLTNVAIDTCALARRLVPDDVPDCRLATLAHHFRTTARPTHRALDDAEATGELLHFLLERAGRLGVLALEDLIDLPTIKGHPHLSKLKLTNGLPRRPGVYLFRDAAGRAIYVGRAANLRRRVRSYFAGGGDEHRQVGSLLRELAAVDHIECSGELESRVLEIRLVHQLCPRYNRQPTTWRRTAFLKLAGGRLTVARTPKPGDHCVYLGPLASTQQARLVVEAVHTARPAGELNEGELLDSLIGKMASLAGAGRCDEAVALRVQIAALSDVLTRQRRIGALRFAGRITVEVPGEGGAIIDQGRLVAAWCDGAVGSAADRDTGRPIDQGRLVAAWCDGAIGRATDRDEGRRPDAGTVGPSWVASAYECERGPVDGPLPCHLADEVACVATWLDERAGRLRLVEGGEGLAWPLGG